MMDLLEKAAAKGGEMRREGVTYMAAMDRCPWQSVDVRRAFAKGWKEGGPSEAEGPDRTP